MSPTRAKYIQLFSEALIPLLGFLLWDWSLYFILLFYFIDLFVDLILTNFKSKRIVDAQALDTKGWMRWSIIGTILFILTIYIIHIATFFVVNGIDFIGEAIKFWTYKELGIQQGIILIPLVALVAVQQYKMEFIRQKQFNSVGVIELWKGKSIGYLALIAFSGLVIGLSSFVVFQEWVYVVAIVFFTSLYQLIAKG